MINDISAAHVKDNPLLAELDNDSMPATLTPAVTPGEETESAEPEENNSDITITKDGNETDIEIPAYTVRGELGSLITNELNSIFKNTNNKVELRNVPLIRLTVDGSNKIQESAEGYIYASDLKSINDIGVTKFVDNVLNASSENYKDKICYIDPNESPKGNIDLAVDILSLNGVSVVFSKDLLVSHLTHAKA